MAYSLGLTNDILKPVQLVWIDVTCRKLRRLDLPKLEPEAAIVFRPLGPSEPFKRLVCGGVKVVLGVSALLGGVVDDIDAVLVAEWVSECVLIVSSVVRSLDGRLGLVELRALDFGQHYFVEMFHALKAALLDRRIPLKSWCLLVVRLHDGLGPLVLFDLERRVNFEFRALFRQLVRGIVSGLTASLKL